MAEDLRSTGGLRCSGGEGELANPDKTNAIVSARIKTDKLKDWILEHLLKAFLTAVCYV